MYSGIAGGSCREVLLIKYFNVVLLVLLLFLLIGCSMLDFPYRFNYEPARHGEKVSVSLLPGESVDDLPSLSDEDLVDMCGVELGRDNLSDVDVLSFDYAFYEEGALRVIVHVDAINLLSSSPSVRLDTIFPYKSLLLLLVPGTVWEMESGELIESGSSFEYEYYLNGMVSSLFKIISLWDGSNDVVVFYDDGLMLLKNIDLEPIFGDTLFEPVGG
jgi:hypothetical protein